MLMKSMVLHNFRSYHGDVSIEFGKLTAFVGKNDIGKSTILEALDVFFNDSKGVVKIDKPDINIVAAAEGDNEISISICFEDLPDRVVIDATNETTLQAEYLLNGIGQLEIVKRYPNAGNTKIFIRANHPVNQHCSDLLSKKDTELKRILDDQEIECNDRTRNAVMREAIRNHHRAELQLNITDIDVSKNDAKSIWEKLQTYLPIYSLFQADRKNCDGDSEVQDPLKEAVKSILNENDISELLERVAQSVDAKLREVSLRTLDKIRELNPELANTLTPSFPPSASLKWADVFKNVSIAGDENIPINKRGSGVKRMILFNFFRAEAERKLLERENASIIYAIEEPETSQHVANQRLLVRAFKTLSELQNTQILITTHSPVVVKELDFDNLRLISIINDEKNVIAVQPNELPYPSLNEINFAAFSEISEEYHNELYGHIEEQGWLAEYKNGKPLMTYIREQNGTCTPEQKTLSEYIRHQIHHPENHRNVHYTPQQLEQSINDMRTFISLKHI
ncbi:MAG: ATP/GTP-binding protein [Firmicutes bacterium HGW-Firmicutes-9]|jgi:predicted ATP-dependent endonuclease of OLD family|nr:MAG: ATP/GTP-binding protein [Firmicutes bacterium HGW-Firmicutes-9]